MIYLIANSSSDQPDRHLLKIGKSGDPVARLHNLQTGSPHSLHLVGCWHTGDELADYRHESWLHQRLAYCQVSGEWFSLTPVELEWVIGALSRIEASFLQGF